MNKRLYKSIGITGLTLLLIYVGLKTYQLMITVGEWLSIKTLLLLIGFEIGLLLLWMAVFIYLFLPDYYAGREKRILIFREKKTYLSLSLVTIFIALPSFLILFSPLFNLETIEHRPILFPQYRLVTYFVTNVLAAIFLTRDHRKLVSLQKLTLAFLLSGFVFVLTLNFQNVVNYPFSLSWAEGNRMWENSMLFVGDRYDHSNIQNIDLLTTPGRQTLWGLVYFIPRLPIWGMRLWNAILLTIPYFILGMMLFKNKNVSESVNLFLSMWTFLFLQQGPIWTPLVLCAILVAGSRNKPLIVSVVLVGLSGYYAQLSRFTWAFAPAMWVGMWTLGKASLERRSISKEVWVRAIIYVIAGLIGGVILPLVLKTNQSLTVEGISGSITQHPLIWSRLWPNPTFAPGIILGLVIAITPILLILGHLVITKRWRLSFWQSLAIGAGLLAFFVVGLIISVKIGGGGNLHNLDMFLISLVFVIAVAWERGGLEWIQSRELSPWIGYILILAVLQPIVHPLVSSQPLYLPNGELTRISLKKISNKVSEAAGKGEVLFLDQRQLLTFDYVDQIPLVDEYEKKIVMNEDMEGNKTYFEGFYRDLADHRFSMIITQPLKTSSFSDEEHNFGLEHNAWLEWVDEPLQCYYQRMILFSAVKVELLVPREEPCEDANQYE